MHSMTAEKIEQLKKELYQLCINHAKERIETAQQAIAASQEAAEEETKSSAGDKYETGREMMQQETDRNRAQLNEANKLIVALNSIKAGCTSTVAEPGSLVETDNGYFYMAISAGTLKLDGKTFYAISPSSPIGQKLKGLKPGDEFALNGKTYRIKAIC
jgi:transcription elongation GreA/GreB family factor